jgi:hypothetical protein
MRKINYSSLILSISLIGIIAIQCSDMGKNPGPDINDPPQITSSANAVAIETEVFSYKATAIDADETSPSISYSNFPSWLALAGDSLTGTTPIAAVDTSFEVTATDGEFADTLLVTVSIIAGGISYSAEIQPTFDNSCAVSGCHVVGSAPANLILDSYTNVMAGSQSGQIVIPYLPDSSIIVQQVEGTRQPQMPFGRAPLSSATIQKIRDWIAQGARNN